MDTREAVKARKEMESRIYQFVFDEMHEFENASGIQVENIKLEFVSVHHGDGLITRLLDHVKITCLV